MTKSDIFTTTRHCWWWNIEQQTRIFFGSSIRVGHSVISVVVFYSLFVSWWWWWRWSGGEVLIHFNAGFGIRLQIVCWSFLRLEKHNMLHGKEISLHHIVVGSSKWKWNDDSIASHIVVPCLDRGTVMYFSYNDIIFLPLSSSIYTHITFFNARQPPEPALDWRKWFFSSSSVRSSTSRRVWFKSPSAQLCSRRRDFSVCRFLTRREKRALAWAAMFTSRY